MSSSSRARFFVFLVWVLALTLTFATASFIVSLLKENVPKISSANILANAALLEASLTALPTASPSITFSPFDKLLSTPTTSTYSSHLAIPSIFAPTATNLPWASPSIRIGYSVAGQPLEVYRFGLGKTARMIVAGVHGGYEWNTIALADELIEYLTAHPDAIPLNTRLYILRSLNPDGEMRSHSFDGRANDNGVDINRNFPAYWQATWPREGCWDHGSISAGEFSASEPETAALINFIETHPIDALLSLHSAALGIFPGGRPPDSASIDLAQTIAAASPYPYPPIDLGCLMTGQLADWASLNGIAAVDVELSNHTETDFDINLAILSAFLNWQR